MKLYSLLFVLILAACHYPTEEDLVRENRRKYEISIGDYTFVNPETNTLAYEIVIKNNAGELALNDLTLDIQILDESGQAFFTTRKSIDVSGINKGSTKAFTFNHKLEKEGWVAAECIFDLAPDDEGSGYENYPEFERIVKKK